MTEPRRALAPLPPRRPAITCTVDWERIEWIVGFGVDQDGFIREIFVDGVKAGTSLDASADDCCILASKLMQEGYRVEEILAMLCSPPAEGDNYSPSLISTLLEKAVEMESEFLEGRRL